MTQKRQLLVDTALELFYLNGIKSIGINEVLKVSGVAKKTLYNYFESKNALILAVLEQRHTVFIEWLESQLKKADTDKEIVSILFTALKSWLSSAEPKLGEFRGCFFVNTSAEFSNPNSDIALYCQHHKKHVHQVISQYMPNTEPLFIDAICIMKEGVINAAYVANDHTAAKKGLQILEKLQEKF